MRQEAPSAPQEQFGCSLSTPSVYSVGSWDDGGGASTSAMVFSHGEGWPRAAICRRPRFCPVLGLSRAKRRASAMTALAVNEPAKRIRSVEFKLTVWKLIRGMMEKVFLPHEDSHPFRA